LQPARNTALARQNAMAANRSRDVGRNFTGSNFYYSAA
jgi:hypothetical protein